MSRRLSPSVFALVAILALRLLAPSTAAAAEASPPVGPLDRLKALEGEWKGDAQHGEEKFPVTVTYRTTAAGHAVIETLFQGTPHEMVTVYTEEGGRLALTHYCASGNHPRMKERAGAGTDRLVFEFAGGTGFDPKKDTHMHDAVVRFVDADHVHSEWTSWDGGRATGKAVFDLTRIR